MRVTQTFETFLRYWKVAWKKDGRSFLLDPFYSPVFHLYNPRKCQKFSGFLIFSGGLEMEHWREVG